MRHLKPHHLKEWRSSVVDERIIEFNVHSVEGLTPYDHDDDIYSSLLYALPSSERRNDGRLTQKWLSKYRHLEHGGWACQGIDPLTGLRDDWGCIKPDQPRPKRDEDGNIIAEKSIKYETPPKTSTKLFALSVSYRIGLQIARKCNQEADYFKRITNDAKVNQWTEQEILEKEDPQFWPWVIKNPNVPIVITEGAKKGGALLSAGYAAIALPGIFNGCPKIKNSFGDDTGFYRLIPELEIFAIPDRPIAFCFDHDEKPRTVTMVRKAIKRTGDQLSQKGCQVSVVSWSDPYKGVDDLIAAKGADYFEMIFTSRSSFGEFKRTAYTDIRPWIDLNLDQPYFPNNPDQLPIPPEVKLLALRGQHGTGKTELIAGLVARAIADNRKVLVVTHRQQLARALAQRFGLDYRTDIPQSAQAGELGYALCIDSLHLHAKPKFDPEQWSDALIVFDEIEQVLWHVLAGGTCQKNRCAILASLRRLLALVAEDERGQIAIADADLSLISVNYFRNLMGRDIKTYIINNAYIANQGRKLYRYADPYELLQAVDAKLFKDEKLIIHVDGQKDKTQVGTRNLEKRFKQKFPDKKILRLDSHTVKDQQHPAYGCIENLNATLKDFDLVICSPVVETGVSIDLKPHFDAVFVISHGVQTVEGVVQAMQRVRDHVERHVYVKKQAYHRRVGNGSTSVGSLILSQRKAAKAIIQQLHSLGVLEPDSIDLYDDGNDKRYPASLAAWAQYAAVMNAHCQAFAEQVFNKAQQLGYDLLDALPINDAQVSTPAQNKQELKAIAAQSQKEHCQAIASSDHLSHAEYETLKEKRGRTQQQDHQVQRQEISYLYQTNEIDAELVHKHENGWYPKLLLHYYLTMGNPHLAQRDSQTLDHLKETETGQIFAPDVTAQTLTASVFALEVLGIKRFLDAAQEFSHDDIKEWHQKIVENFSLRSQLKTLLDLSISNKESPIAFVQKLLKKLGLKLTLVNRRRINSVRKRFYRGAEVNPDGRSAIFERWRKRDAELAAPEKMEIAV